MSDVRADALGKKAEEESYSVKNGEGAISNERINGDRLSELPNEILIHILSRLGFHHAAVTCVLSKRWRFLWTDMATLNFSNRSRGPEKTRDFVSWVHRTIISRSSGSYVDQFSVAFFYNECYASDVNAWIHFALKNGVKYLSVDLYSDGYFYSSPQLLYLDSSLTRMSLRRCILAPPRKVEWPHLTNLRVEVVELPQEVIEKILSGCPVLGYLGLRSCWGFTNISSASIHKLEVWDNNYRNNVDLLEISAPCLSSLDISFSPREKKLRLTNLPSSLDYAEFHYTEFDYSPDVMNSTMELLEKTQHANCLALGGTFVGVLSEMVTQGWHLPQSTRLWLKLDIARRENTIPGLLRLLESSPNLQDFVIQSPEPYEETETIWGPSPMNELDCDLLNLKTVGLFNIADTNLHGEPMLTMARSLLKRATTLEKMEIMLEDIYKGSPDFTQMFETVRSYPRSSEKAEVVFCTSTDEGFLYVNC